MVSSQKLEINNIGLVPLQSRNHRLYIQLLLFWSIKQYFFNGLFNPEIYTSVIGQLNKFPVELKCDDADETCLLVSFYYSGIYGDKEALPGAFHRADLKCYLWREYPDKLLMW